MAGILDMGINPNQTLRIGGLSGTDSGGLLGTFNNPLIGLAAGLLSGRDPGGTLSSGLQQGLSNMQGMQHAALQGSLLRNQLDQYEKQKQREEQNRRAMQGLLGTEGNTPADGMGPVMPGSGLLGNPETAGIGGILQALPEDVQGQFLAEYALQQAKPLEDRTPADLLALQQAFGPDVGMQKWIAMNQPSSNSTVINNIPKPDFGFAYNDPNDPSKGVYVVPGSAPDTALRKIQSEKDATWNTYETAMAGLKDALSAADTGPVVGRVPAVTSAQQTADGAVAAIAPVMKQLFRSAGEGVFTDKDQEMLIKMIPTRIDTAESRAAKIANIDSIVRAKLSKPGITPTNPSPNKSVDDLVNQYANPR